MADRFASSTLAYQGGGGGMPTDQILQVAEIAVDRTWPDLTVVFDLDIDQAMARLNPQKTGAAIGGLFHDRIEQRDRDYFQRVRANFLWQVGQWPDRYRIVDAGKNIPQVEKQVRKVLGDFFKADTAI